MDRPGNIIIVDDLPLFRDGIRMIIEKEEIARVSAVADNGAKLIELLDSHDPDMVLMDIEMPVMDGIEATKRALKMKPELKVLVLTMLDGTDNLAEMIKAGALGFVRKTADSVVLRKAITTVMEGENYYSIDAIRSIVSSTARAEPAPADKGPGNIEISDREFEVLKYLCKGYSIPEVADAIFRSPKTVEAHRARLLEKTNSRNTLNLVLYAIKNKLVEI